MTLRELPFLTLNRVGSSNYYLNWRCETAPNSYNIPGYIFDYLELTEQELEVLWSQLRAPLTSVVLVAFEHDNVIGTLMTNSPIPLKGQC